jgi:hypothetical protein
LYVPLIDSVYDWIGYSARDAPLGTKGVVEEMEKRMNEEDRVNFGHGEWECK